MTIRLGRFGLHARVMPDATNKMWLSFVIWYPRGRATQGYLYPSIRWIGRA